MSNLVSHGRGGAANITKDDTQYADGGIVREGVVGDQGDGAYSAGRGGTGNIGSPGVKPTQGAHPHDGDVVPETALRPAKDENFHYGRGGEGNEIKKPSAEKKEGLADKLKNKLFGHKADKSEETNTSTESK